MVCVYVCVCVFVSMSVRTCKIVRVYVCVCVHEHLYKRVCVCVSLQSGVHSTLLPTQYLDHAKITSASMSVCEALQRVQRVCDALQRVCV